MHVSERMYNYTSPLSKRSPRLHGLMDEFALRSWKYAHVRPVRSLVIGDRSEQGWTQDRPFGGRMHCGQAVGQPGVEVSCLCNVFSARSSHCCWMELLDREETGAEEPAGLAAHTRMYAGSRGWRNCTSPAAVCLPARGSSMNPTALSAIDQPP